MKWRELMKILRYILLLFVFSLSYWAGFFSYESTLWLVWEQTLGGDKRAVVYWSLLAYLVILVPLYLLICYTIETKIKHKSAHMF